MFNFIITENQEVAEEMKVLMFDLEEGEHCEILPMSTTMLDITVKVGMFKSKGQARKNFNKAHEIEGGFTKHVLTKKKKEVYVWKEIV